MIKIAITSLIVFASTLHSDEVSLAATGDVLLTRKIVNFIEKEGEKYPFIHIADILKKADICLGNLESSISTKGKPILKKEFNFRADPKRIEGLKFAGFDVLNLANNHSMDYGKEALIETMDLLKKDGFETIGAGKNLKEANNGVIIEKNGIKFGFLGYSLVLSSKCFVTSKSAGVINGYKPHKYIKEGIKSLRDKVDFIIVSFHWGEECTFYPNKIQKDLAKLVIDEGADVIIGHHPHVMQGVEIYKKKPIFYSLGNFVFLPSFRKPQETILPIIKFSKDGIKEISIHPVFISKGQPKIQDEDTSKAILKQMATLCYMCGTKTSIDDKEKVIKVEIEDSGMEQKGYYVRVDKSKLKLKIMDKDDNLVSEFPVLIGKDKKQKEWENINTLKIYNDKTQNSIWIKKRDLKELKVYVYKGMPVKISDDLDKH